MDERLRIMTKYKKQFRQYFEETMATSCMVWGLEVPDAWLPIIEDVCEAVEAENISMEWDQVKEKFGMLRLYYRLLGNSDTADSYLILSDIVMTAEEAVEEYEKNRRNKE